MNLKIVNISLLCILIVSMSVLGFLTWSYFNADKEQIAKGKEPISSGIDKETITVNNTNDEIPNESNDYGEYIEAQDENREVMESTLEHEEIQPIVDKGVWYQGEYYIEVNDLPKLNENASKSEIDEYNAAIRHLSLLWGEPIFFDDITRIINIPDAPELTIEYFSTTTKEYELEGLGKGAEISFLFSNLSNDFNIDVSVYELYVDGYYIEDPYHSMRAKIGHGDTFQNVSINVSSVSLFADNPIKNFPEFNESIVGQFHITYDRVQNDPNIDVPDSIRIPFVIDL